MGNGMENLSLIFLKPSFSDDDMFGSRILNAIQAAEIFSWIGGFKV